MGNKQSYDLTKAQNAQGVIPSEEQQDQSCRPVSMASTSSMRKPAKSKKKAKDTDKENVSMGSARTETASPVEEITENREAAIDVPEEPAQPTTVVESLEDHRREEPLLALSSPYYDQVPVVDEVLVKAYEVPHISLGVLLVKEITPMEEKVPVESMKEEKERAKQVAEEAVKHVEAKRNSQDCGTQSVVEQTPPECSETLRRVSEVGLVPLEQGGSRSEEEEIEEATRQLDDAIHSTDETMCQESAVVLEESAVEDFATVTLARDEDISAIAAVHPSSKETQALYSFSLILLLQKLHYTNQLRKQPLDAAPSQTHYIRLK